MPALSEKLAFRFAGYNFSIAGVAEPHEWTILLAEARSQSAWMARSTFDRFTNGQVWNMIVDPPTRPRATCPLSPGDELWRRLQRFLEEALPVAGEGLRARLAAHPDDPPTPTMRQQPRLVYQQAMYQRLIDISTSPSNMLEFCLGTLAEMTEGDIYQTVDRYSSQHRIAYVHFRNGGRQGSRVIAETFDRRWQVDMSPHPLPSHKKRLRRCRHS